MKTLVIGIVVIALGFFGLVWFKTAPSDDTTVGEIGNFTPYTKGLPTAKIKLTEYADFQCPACGAVAPVISDLLAKYPNDIQLIFKHFPLTQIHPHALLASKVAEAAGKQGKFFEMYYLLFTGQTEWAKNSKAENIFTLYATNLGLDLDQFKTDLKDTQISEKIKSDQIEGTKNGVQGTPTFFINGIKLDNNNELLTRIEAVIK